VNLYWSIVEHRAVDYFTAQSQPDAPLLAGLPVLAAHAAQFSPFHTLHVAQFLLAAIVADAFTVLMAAEEQSRLFGGRLDEALLNVEDQVAATRRARATVQQVLEQVPHGRAGRARMLDIVYELRDDPRAIAGVLALTTAALREVAVQRGPADASAGQ
jgi:hypothetical protein